MQSTCTEVDGAVLVTKRYLSDLDSRGLGCEPDAPVVHEYTNEYPRCAGHTGTATSCADLHGLDGPYPHKHAGMVTLYVLSYLIRLLPCSFTCNIIKLPFL